MVNKKIIAVAMSGGVDSSTSALLLKKDGYEVVGITGLMHAGKNNISAVEKAAEVCKLLQIEHHTVDLKQDFKDKVIDYFEESYKKGLTPNPCTVCNRAIKWGALRQYAKDNLGIELYATGHYARITRDNDSCKLCKAGDVRKDQIYMLFNLTQENLAHTIFPLQNLTKSQVREIAKDNGLPCAESKESQDVCFIQPPDSTQKYLARTFGEKEGKIIDCKTGEVLGKHNGAFKYTTGQRKGIGIAATEPLYVTSVDPKNNIVYVGFLKELSKSEFNLININWQQEEFKEKEFQALVKIRYNSKAKEAIVIPEGNRATVRFKETEFAITPGQAGVFYDLNNEYLIGGGWII